MTGAARAARSPVEEDVGEVHGAQRLHLLVHLRPRVLGGELPAGDAREAKKAGKAPAPAPKPEPKSNALNTPFNAPLFFAVPAASIVGVVYYLATLDA